MYKPRLKPKKAVQVIAYIKSKIPRVSKLKLAMILFHVDMESYLKTGKSMTGLAYTKGEKHIEINEKQLAKVLA